MAEYPVEIPDAAREVKANYPTRPSEQLVREIRQFIKDNGTPFLWTGHTHTTPPQGATIVYCGEFDLPASHAGPKNRARWSPCPCCHPETAWYWKAGKIAWFPEESVIRNIGRDCFKAINATGHEFAEAEFRREERDRRNREYLLANLRVVPEAVRIIERALPAIRDVETARRILSGRLAKIIGFDIWNDVRGDATLKVHIQRTEHFTRADGSEDSRVVGVAQPFGALPGHVMLNPAAKSLSEKLERELEKLRLVDFGEQFAERLEGLDDEERHKVANSLGKPLAIAKEVYAETNECRRFLSPEAIATLNGWGKHELNPVRLYLKLEPSVLLIGRSQDATQPMKIGKDFFNVLEDLPTIGNVRDH